ncbi:MAG TPA: hypothetical protein HA224_00315 [Nanoarchaeota archaeon]|nr:hypothetical protein [Nanoarchaeota archaeon]
MRHFKSAHYVWHRKHCNPNNCNRRKCDSYWHARSLRKRTKNKV